MICCVVYLQQLWMADFRVSMETKDNERAGALTNAGEELTSGALTRCSHLVYFLRPICCFLCGHMKLRRHKLNILHTVTSCCQ